MKEPWAGPAWGCRRGQGSVTGTGCRQGEEWHTGWRPRSRLPFPSAEALGQLLSDTRDIVALTSAQCRPLETRSSVGFALRRALRGGAALPLSLEGLAEDGAAARSHEWTEAVCAEAVATWRKPTWGAGSAGGGGSPFRSDPASFPSTLEIARHFRFGSQEDAHEFLRYTIDAMQKACLSGCARCGGRAPAGEGAPPAPSSRPGRWQPRSVPGLARDSRTEAVASLRASAAAVDVSRRFRATLSRCCRGRVGRTWQALRRRLKACGRVCRQEAAILVVSLPSYRP